MHILRKVALGILSPLFIFLLFAIAFDIGFIHTATHPVTVKKIVAESGVYDTVVPNLLRQTKVISTPLGDIPTSDPAVQAAANKAVSPQDIQKQTEAAIDSIYQWLDGKISQPSFTIGVGGNNTDFANNVAQSVQQKLAGLPVCNAAQSLVILRSEAFDAVNATCLPRGVTTAEVAAGVRGAIAANPDFSSQASINSTSIKSSSGQPVFNQPDVKNVPRQYQRAKKTPLILTIVTVLTGLGIVFLSSSWPKGLRHIGLNLLIIGLMMLVFSWALNRTVSTKIAPKIKLDNEILQQDVRNLVTDLGQQVDKSYWFFGGAYTLFGAAAIAGGQIALRKRSAPKPLDTVKIDLVSHPNKK